MLCCVYECLAGLVYFLMDRVSKADSATLYLCGTTGVLIEELRSFTRTLAAAGVRQVWVSKRLVIFGDVR